MERKRLVLDANILIRGCLGLRVKCLIATYADQVDFYVAESNVTEAAHYIAELAKKKQLDVNTCTDTLLSLMQIVQQMGDTMLESALALALQLECAIWTEDQDFFGTGIATWTTNTVEIYLKS